MEGVAVLVVSAAAREVVAVLLSVGLCLGWLHLFHSGRALEMLELFLRCRGSLRSLMASRAPANIQPGTAMSTIGSSGGSGGRLQLRYYTVACF